MQKVTALLPSWDKTKTTSKKGFDKAWGWADKLGAPVNRLSNRIGSEAFWPTTLDKESDKAARILRSFCKDGFYAQEDRSLGNLEGPAANTKQRVLKKIPAKVIQNAVGLAIFTTMRTGLWISGAGGSGVLIARQENGEWSPPSGILLHTAGLGFLVGVDVYDCVLIINNRKALESFTKLRATLGGEISAVAGPVGAGGVLENDGKWKQLNKPVFTYLKSRGFYAGVQVDGTVVIERTDENERFYGERIGVTDILAGKARHPPIHDIKMLMETIKAAEGRSDVDQDLMDELEGQPAPGDVNVDNPTREYEPSFGIPEPDDPDPFGVLALEKAGLEIREAGTRSRPPSSQFEYRPNPTSPVFSTFSKRRSMDTLASRTGRESYMSHKSRNSVDRAMQTMESGTQTEGDSSIHSPSSVRSLENGVKSPQSPIGIIKEEENHKVVPEVEEVDYTKIDLGPYGELHHENSSHEFNGSGTTANSNPRSLTSDLGTKDKTEEHDETEDFDDDGASDIDDEEPVVFEAAAAQTTRPPPVVNVVQARGSLVTIPKRIPPALPPRSPMRGSRQMNDAGSMNSRSPSPIKDGFESVDLVGNDGLLSPEKRGSLEHQSSLGQETSPLENLEKSESAKADVHLSDLDKAGDPVMLGEVERVKTPVMPGGFDEADENMEKHALRKDDEEDKFHSLPVTPANEAAAFA